METTINSENRVDEKTSNTRPVDHVPYRSIYDKFLEFRSVVIQTIAKAWEDTEFHKKLIDKSAQRANPDHVMRMMENEFGYEFPFKKKITIDVLDGNAEWEPVSVNDWVVKKQEKLIMVLPPKPENKSDQAMALTDYIRTHIAPY